MKWYIIVPVPYKGLIPTIHWYSTVLTHLSLRFPRRLPKGCPLYQFMQPDMICTWYVVWKVQCSVGKYSPNFRYSPLADDAITC
jgi:hypothetical protein